MRAEDVAGLLRGEVGWGGIEGVDLGEGDGAFEEEGRGVMGVGADVLCVVEVAIGFGAHDDVVAVGGGEASAGHALPGGDGGAGGEAALEDFVPADEAVVAGFEELFDAFDEVALEFVFVLEAFSFHAGLAVGTGFPAVLGAFVAADVNVGTGEEVADFIEDVFDEGEGGFFAGAVDFFEDAPGCADGEGAAGAGEFGIGGERGKGVAGHFDFGDDVDEAGFGVGDDFADVVLGVEAAVEAGGAVRAARRGRECRLRWGRRGARRFWR